MSSQILKEKEIEEPGFALSPQQRHLVSLLKHSEITGPYIAQITVASDGMFHSVRLQQALCELIRRHEILRTKFVRRTGLNEPIQIILPEDAVSANQISVTFIESDARERPDAQVDGAASHTFEISSGRLVSVIVTDYFDGKTRLTLTLPALCADGQSLKNVIRDLAALYAGEGHLLSEVVQYADGAEYLNDILASDYGALGRQYWHPRVIAAEAARLKPLGLEHEAVFQPAVVKAQLAASIIGQGALQTDRLSAESFLLACWFTLLYRIEARDNLVIGYAASGREISEFQDSVGLFETYVPVTLVNQPESTFADLRLVTAAQIQQAVKWQAAFRWPEDTGIHFTAFSYIEADWSYSAGEVTWKCAEIQVCSDRYDLKLSCVRLPESTVIEFWYDPTVYQAVEIETLCSQFITLAEGAAAYPQTRIAQLNLISENERRQLIHDLNATERPFSITNVETEFAVQAGRTLDAIALVENQNYLTYAELHKRSDQLARHFNSLGIGPESRVALCLDRGIDAIISMLATLKASAAYVPVDPSYPIERQAYMLNDSAAALVLTGQTLRSRYSSFHSNTLCCDQIFFEAEDSIYPLTQIQAPPESAAYMLYTSGSTGRPKGVVITRSGLMNYVRWASERYLYGPGTRTVLCSSLSFDLTITSLWPPLLTGGCIDILPEPDAVEKLINAQACHYDVIKITPSHMRLLQQTHGKRGDSPLARQFVIGGEALRWEELRHWQAPSFATSLINEYGPTETVVGCCIYEATGDGVGPVPIGQSIDNSRAYVVDKDGHLSPLGAPGELLLGGAGVARGYWNQAGLTAERFLPDGFSGRSGERLYQTGDLVRRRIAGELEYLGRLDDQVKLRGYRIELGEIEMALLQHQAVWQCAARIWEDEQGEKRLLAYVVLDSKEATSVADLRVHVKNTLPEYMVPWTFIEVQQIPLTANGKLDLRALPVPSIIQTAGEMQYPRTPIEEILADIWGEVLRLPRVGVNQNFFELGGHSLLATQVISRMRDALKVEIPLRVLFEGPTIVDLAQAVRRYRDAGGSLQAPPISPISRDRDLPLSFAQQRLWFIYQLEPDSPAYNVPFSLRVRGALNISALSQSLGEIMRRHEVLRTRFEAMNGEARQIIADSWNVNWWFCDLSQLVEDEREIKAREIAGLEARRPFDLEQGPIWRAGLMCLAAEEHVLLLSLHHVVSDAWSVNLLVKEFIAFYEACREGLTAILPEPPIQYADYAIWQREWLRGEQLEKHLAYWRRQLSGVSSEELPTDRPRAKATRHRGASEGLSLSAAVTDRLKVLSRREGVTLFMTLLAAFNLALAHYTGRNEVVVGTDVANRNRLETEGLIGFFVNQLVLRTNLSSLNSFRDLLQRVRQTVLDAYQYQDLPFEKIVSEIAPIRHADRSPLFQVKIVLQNVDREQIAIRELTLHRFEDGNQSSKFDMLFNLTETEDGLVCANQYDTDLFNDFTIRSLLRFYETTLNLVATQDALLQVPMNDLLSEINRQARRNVNQGSLRIRSSGRRTTV